MIQIIESGLQPLSFRFRFKHENWEGKHVERLEEKKAQEEAFFRYDEMMLEFRFE